MRISKIAFGLAAAVVLQGCDKNIEPSVAFCQKVGDRNYEIVRASDNVTLHEAKHDYYNLRVNRFEGRVTKSFATNDYTDDDFRYYPDNKKCKIYTHGEMGLWFEFKPQKP